VNDEELRAAPRHVRQEVARIKRLNGDLERALQLAADAIAFETNETPEAAFDRLLAAGAAAR
jgi:hypothetical protein